MAYYDTIARRWHDITGHKGGVFKELVLNDCILGRLPSIARRSILELGAGNGYFMPLLLRRFSGQAPARIVITDQSSALLAIAQSHFKVRNAEYYRLDVRARYPYPENTFNLILAIMVFNEIGDAGLRRALRECHRVLTEDGRLIAAVTHPAFVESLSRRGELKRTSGGRLTMPGALGLRLPVVRRSMDAYERCLDMSGFEHESKDIFPSRRVFNGKPGLRKAGHVPVALLLDCHTPPQGPPSEPPGRPDAPGHRRRKTT